MQNPEQETMLPRNGASLKSKLLSRPCAGLQAEGGPAGREAAPCLQHAHGDPLGYSQPEEVSEFLFFWLGFDPD